MNSEFERYLTSNATLNNEQLDWISSLYTVKTLRKNQYLLQEGDIWKHYVFVVKGCLRTYSLGAKGTEHIIGFDKENYWTGDPESLISGKPSRFNIDCLEPCEVVIFTKQNFELLCKQIPEFYELANMILNKNIIALQNRICATLSYSAEERYEYFMACNPQLALRVPQNMIASYLGIAKETLSRLRGKYTGNHRTGTTLQVG